jgi:hypothetical protein
MHYFEKADIPCLIDQVRFIVGNCEFHIEKTDDSFTVTAKSEAALPEHFHVRIEETLRFILAQSVSCRALVENGQLQLFSGKQQSRRTLLPPPIARGRAAFHEDSWRLFSDYLTYVSREATQLFWHPCSNHLHNACEASANSLDAWAIGLSVAVEGLASLLPKEIDTATKTKLEALQTFIVDHVAASHDYKQFAPRIKGIVNGLTQIRAIDRMNELAANGDTDATFVKAWTKLRNRGVHPVKRGELEIASVDYQRLIDEAHKVVVLMYHIVFNLIGYRGRYTDFAVHGFPEREYPPGVEVPSAEVTSAAAAKATTEAAKSRSRAPPREASCIRESRQVLAKEGDAATPKSAKKGSPCKIEAVRQSSCGRPLKVLSDGKDITPAPKFGLSCNPSNGWPKRILL